MKKFALAVGLLIGTIGFAQTYDANFLDGSILFKLKENVQTAETLKDSPESLKKNENIGDYPKLRNALQAFSISDFSRPIYHTNKEDLQKIYRVKFNNYSEIDEIVKKLSQLENVEYAEKEPIYKLDLVPNDPNYSGTTGKWYHTLVNSEAAWDISQGSSTIKVAIVDNAVYTDHADLTTYKQRDVADNDNDATPPFTNGWSHGTHCAGLATADLNNGVGIASLGGQVELIGIKATPDNAPSGDAIYYGFEGVSWACSNGANVVSMSYGGTTASQAMQNLIDAYPDVVFLAAAGNDGNTTLQYPGAYNNVICVGSVNGNNSPSGFTNYNGATSFVDIASPGGGATYDYGGLLSTWYNGGGTYAAISGTSMATPFLAGLVGNMLSINPTMTPTQILNCLISTGVPTGGSKDIGPRFDAAAALACVAATVTGDPLVQFTGSPTSIYEGQSVTFTDQSNDGGNAITDWQWSFPGGTPSSFNGQTPPAITYAATGIYTVELTVTNSQSAQTKTRTDYINVSLEPYGEWIIQNSGFATVSSGIGHIDIVDVNTVWAVAYDGSGGGGNPQEFTKTTNGGTSWNVQAIDLGDTDLGISMISAIDDMNAWLVAYPQATGDVGGIWKTTDGGVNWTRQNTATYNDAASFSNVVHFWDANNGFCQGDPINGEYENYTTTDGGTTWNLVNGANIPDPTAGEYGYVRDIEVVGDTVWYGTNTGRLYHSTDKGYTWNVYQTPETDMGNAHYSFSNGSTGILTTGGVVWKTTDAGANWTQVTTTGSVFDAGLCYIEGTDVVFTTGQTGSSYSEDGGVNWNIIDTDQHTYCEFINPTVGWSGSFTVSATEHGIWKWNSLNSNLDADFSATPLIVCIGDTVQFTDLTTGGNITDWSWQFFGGTSPDPTAQNPIVYYSAAGQYSVQLTVTDSIGQTTTSKGSYITVEAPAATPLVVGGPNPVCQDSLATYGCPNTPGVFYVWQLPAGWFGSSTTSSITATVGANSGNVSVAASNVCGVSAFKSKAITVNPCGAVGIDELENSVLSIYPNPASTTLNISVDNKLLNSSVNVIDVLGNIVYTSSIKSNIETINISNLSKGMYFVKIEGVDNTIKFIKE
jgi:PKD repeat protein